MTSKPIHNKIYALKFGQNIKSVRADLIHGEHAHPREDLLKLDYFVWVIRTPEEDIVVDAGFTREINKHRKRDHWSDPHEILEEFGVDLDSVNTVIISHLHYDHSGDTEAFPNAQFLLQEDELAFWAANPVLSKQELRRHVEPGDILRFVQYNFDGRLTLVDGSYRVADGVTVHKMYGHTPGTQVIEVETEKGTVILATDASHLYENVIDEHPINVFHELSGVYKSLANIRYLAGKDGVVVPGHDPRLFDHFPAVEGFSGRVLEIA